MKNFKLYFTLIIISGLLHSNPTSHKLGRDNDPRTISDIGKLKLIYKKAFWSSISILGPRNVSKIAYPKSEL